MKRTVSLLAGLLFLSALSMKADSPVFGNSLGGGGSFSLSFASGNTWGGAVLFTPTTDISLSSVTLWLSGYSGQNGITPSVSIYNSYQFGNNLFGMGSQVVSLNAPAPNSGITDAFTFSGSSPATLQANQDYWLFAYGSWDGSAPTFGGASSYWQAGTAPTGNAIFDQSAFFNNGGLSPSTFVPAFSINGPSLAAPVVPEPSTMALLTIPFLFGIGRILYNRANAKKLVPVKVRRSVRPVRRA
ncbi:MAG TPA: choice-of-anchor R domain-containing protein [Pseudomonadales bacterium]|nr:choice-of-anchor R domain-containing protein [Pseudomonadales bacterium]